MDAVGWLDQFSAGDATPLEKARAAEAAQDAREAAEEARREAEKQAAAEQRFESLVFAERQLGSPLAELSRARSALSDASDEVAEAEKQLARARAKQDRARGSIEFWATRAQAVTDSVSRSAPTDPVEAAVSRAHAEFKSVTRQRMAEAQAQVAVRSAGRPKGAGGSVPSLRYGPGHCPYCQAYNVRPEESARLHAELGDVA